MGIPLLFVGVLLGVFWDSLGKIHRIVYILRSLWGFGGFWGRPLALFLIGDNCAIAEMQSRVAGLTLYNRGLFVTVLDTPMRLVHGCEG